MKLNHYLAIAIFILFAFTGIASPNPLAAPEAMVISGDMRFTVLTPEMIRIEWRSGADKQFVDKATFAVINRRLPVPEFKKYEKDGFLYIETSKLKLQYRLNSFPGTFDPASSRNLKITFEMNGRTVVWYPWKKDALNLKGTCRTLDSSNGDNKRAELEKGLISRSGWAVVDDSETRSDGSKSLLLEPNEDAGFDWVAERSDKAGMDWYFMGYGHDYKKALYDFTQISGKIPMPPLYAFGYWYSKYQKYNEQDFKDLVTEMETNDIPIDVMVIDTDWHINGWTGWSWNKSLFPNPKEFLNWLHNHDLKVTLNLHPAYGIQNNEDNYSQFVADLGGVPDGTTTVEWNLENVKFYKSLFKNILRPHEKNGVDFWWLDWQQWLLSDKVDGLGHTYWVNYVFYNDMAKTYPDKRAMIFHRWGGLGNHRYQLGFSGDSHSNFATLAFQPYFTATASNVGYGYWGHDLGGHVQSGDNNPELYLRWIQYGVFSPLFRTHSTNAANIERRIWKYPNFDLMKEAFELRYSLVPYIYTQARKAYDTGVSICRPLYYDNPETNEAYDNEGEYMFGDDILVNPITKAATIGGSVSQSTWLPEGSWYDVCRNELREGGNIYTDLYAQNEIPYFYKAGAIVPKYPKMSNLKQRPKELILEFAPGGNGEMKLYEDENDSERYKENSFSFTRITQDVQKSVTRLNIYPTEGKYDGMPTERSYVLKVLGSSKPESVSVNGKTFNLSSVVAEGKWTYQDDKKLTIISLPITSCAKQIEVVLNYSAASVEINSTNKMKCFNYNRYAELVELDLSTKTEPVNIQITNTEGQTLFNEMCSKTDIFQLSVANWNPGLYLCTISSDIISETFKFIK